MTDAALVEQIRALIENWLSSAESWVVRAREVHHDTIAYAESQRIAATFRQCAAELDAILASASALPQGAEQTPHDKLAHDALYKTGRETMSRWFKRTFHGRLRWWKVFGGGG